MSARNLGLGNSTLKNVSPWLLTIGASTIDRKWRAMVILDDGVNLEGQLAYQP